MSTPNDSPPAWTDQIITREKWGTDKQAAADPWQCWPDHRRTIVKRLGWEDPLASISPVFLPARRAPEREVTGNREWWAPATTVWDPLTTPHRHLAILDIDGEWAVNVFDDARQAELLEAPRRLMVSILTALGLKVWEPGIDDWEVVAWYTGGRGFRAWLRWLSPMGSGWGEAWKAHLSTLAVEAEVPLEGPVHLDLDPLTRSPKQCHRLAGKHPKTGRWSVAVPWNILAGDTPAEEILKGTGRPPHRLDELLPVATEAPAPVAALFDDVNEEWGEAQALAEALAAGRSTMPRLTTWGIDGARLAEALEPWKPRQIGEKGWRLRRECPACGKRNVAFVVPSGRLKCWDDGCPATRHGDGIPIREWAPDIARTCTVHKAPERPQESAEPRPLVSTEECRKRVSQAVVQARGRGVVLIAGPTGSGKSRAAKKPRAVEQSDRGDAILYALPTRRANEEAGADLRRMGADRVVVIESRRPETEDEDATCYRYEEAEALLQRGLSPGKYLCPKGCEGFTKTFPWPKDRSPCPVYASRARAEAWAKEKGRKEAAAEQKRAEAAEAKEAQLAAEEKLAELERQAAEADLNAAWGTIEAEEQARARVEVTRAQKKVAFARKKAARTEERATQAEKEAAEAKGVIVVTTHDYYARMWEAEKTQRPFNPDLVVLDEDPTNAMLYTEESSAVQLNTAAERLGKLAWQTPETAGGVEALKALATILQRLEALDPTAAMKSLGLKDLRLQDNIVPPCEALALLSVCYRRTMGCRPGTLAEVLEAVDGHPDNWMPPPPDGEDFEVGKLPDYRVRDLVAAMQAPAGVEAPWRLSFAYDPRKKKLFGARLHLARHLPPWMPGDVLLLDATGNQECMAQLLKVDVEAPELPAPEIPGVKLLWDRRRLSRSKVDRHKEGIGDLARERLLPQLQEHVPEGSRVLVFTFMRHVEALQGEVDNWPWDIKIEHFWGATSKATNEHVDADVVVLFGTPRPSVAKEALKLSAIHAGGEPLSVNLENDGGPADPRLRPWWKVEAYGQLYQAGSRPRFGWGGKEGTILVFGDLMPDVWKAQAEVVAREEREERRDRLAEEVEVGVELAHLLGAWTEGKALTQLAMLTVEGTRRGQINAPDEKLNDSYLLPPASIIYRMLSRGEGQKVDIITELSRAINWSPKKIRARRERIEDRLKAEGWEVGKFGPDHPGSGTTWIGDRAQAEVVRAQVIHLAELLKTAPVRHFSVPAPRHPDWSVFINVSRYGRSMEFKAHRPSPEPPPMELLFRMEEFAPPASPPLAGVSKPVRFILHREALIQAGYLTADKYEADGYHEPVGHFHEPPPEAPTAVLMMLPADMEETLGMYEGDLNDRPCPVVWWPPMMGDWGSPCIIFPGTLEVDGPQSFVPPRSGAPCAKVCPHADPPWGGLFGGPPDGFDGTSREGCPPLDASPVASGGAPVKALTEHSKPVPADLEVRRYPICSPRPDWTPEALVTPAWRSLMLTPRVDLPQQLPPLELLRHLDKYGRLLDPPGGSVEDRRRLHREALEAGGLLQLPGTLHYHQLAPGEAPGTVVRVELKAEPPMDSWYVETLAALKKRDPKEEILRALQEQTRPLADSVQTAWKSIEGQFRDSAALADIGSVATIGAATLQDMGGFMERMSTSFKAQASMLGENTAVFQTMAEFMAQQEKAMRPIAAGMDAFLDTYMDMYQEFVPRLNEIIAPGGLGP